MRSIICLAFCLLVASAASVCTGNSIASAAQSVVGVYPYSWGGGNTNGATFGVKQQFSPYCDDSRVMGFDCSGLSMFCVFQGCGISLVHSSKVQYENCPMKVPIADLEVGDLVFYGRSTSSITHVAIYVGNNQMVEASGHNPDCSGVPVRQTALRKGSLIPDGCRYHQKPPSYN